MIDFPSPFSHKLSLKHSLLRYLLLLLLPALLAVFLGDVALAQDETQAQSCATPVAVIIADSAPVRSGPGDNFVTLNTVPAGAEYVVLGRHLELPWWRIVLSEDEQGWIENEQLQVRGDLAQIPLLDSQSQAVDAQASWAPATMLPCLSAEEAPSAGPEETAESPEEEQPWSLPLNLSRSGQAIEPRLVLDAAGTAHIVWTETGLQQFLYVRGDGQNWEPPRQVELPFGTRDYFPDLSDDSPTPLFAPRLVLAGDGRIHAFWLDEERILWHSVLGGDFADFGDWSQRQQLTDSAQGLDIISAGGLLYASFIRPAETAEQPAGVYVLPLRLEEDGDLDFAEPVAVSHSRYLAAADETTAHTRLTMVPPAAEGEASTLIVAWDNRPLDRVFVARSSDGGASWSEAVVVDSRQEDDDPEAVGPSRIQVLATGQNVLVVWQVMHAGQACSQDFRRSSDGGATWSEREKLVTVPGCPTYMELMPAPEGQILLLTGSTQGATLRAWNGTFWSEQQPQDVLTEFTNQETFRPVRLHCLQVQWLEGWRLLVAGCSGSAPVDIWATSRQLPPLEPWFQSGPDWSTEHTLALGSTPPDQVGSVHLTADNVAGRFHAFWSVPGGAAIRYAQAQEGQWTGAVELLSSPDGATASHVATVYGADNTIHAVWDSTDGQVYYSRANADSAGQPGTWAAPRALPAAQPNATLPVIARSPSGVLYVAYTIPINEGRGIYLTSSEDGGNTWRDPVEVFDGGAAGWQMVGPSHLAVTAAGEAGTAARVHLFWSPGPSSNVEGPTLYYAYADDGQSFSTVPLVEDVPAEAVALLTEGAQTLHRFWITRGEVNTLWHTYSSDGGLTWADDVEFSNRRVTLSFATDSANSLHLLQTDDSQIVHLQWDGVRWLTRDQVEWERAVPPRSAFAISPDGDLMAAYVVPSSSGDGGHEIIVLGRQVGAEGEEITETTPAPQPSTTPAAVGTAGVDGLPLAENETPTPEPTPTLAFSTTVNGEVPRMVSNVVIDAAGIGGLVGVALVALIVLVIVVRSYASSRRS
jgi:hypothetical protein